MIGMSDEPEFSPAETHEITSFTPKRQGDYEQRGLIPAGSVKAVIERFRFNDPVFAAIEKIVRPQLAASVALASGLFTAVWARMSSAITDDAVAAPVVLSVLNFGKGLGNVAAGPVGGVLVASSRSAGGSESVDYRWAIVFAGVCMIASTAVICLGYLRQRGLSFARRS